MVDVNYQLSRVWDRRGDGPLYMLAWGIILLALIKREEGPPVVGTIPWQGSRTVGHGESIVSLCFLATGAMQPVLSSRCCCDFSVMIGCNLEVQAKTNPLS